MVHNNIRIFGKVQGVFFREGAQEKAEKLIIKGWIKNLSDGSVYIEAEGKPENLEKFIDWCHKGSGDAKVDRVEVEEGNMKNFTGFEVK